MISSSCILGGGGADAHLVSCSTLPRVSEDCPFSPRPTDLKRVTTEPDQITNTSTIPKCYWPVLKFPTILHHVIAPFTDARGRPAYAQATMSDTLHWVWKRKFTIIDDAICCMTMTCHRQPGYIQEVSYQSSESILRRTFSQKQPILDVIDTDAKHRFACYFPSYLVNVLSQIDHA